MLVGQEIADPIDLDGTGEALGRDLVDRLGRDLAVDQVPGVFFDQDRRRRDRRAGHGQRDAHEQPSPPNPVGMRLWRRAALLHGAGRGERAEQERLQILESMGFQWVGDRGRRHPSTGQASSNKKPKVAKKPVASTKRVPPAAPARGLKGSHAANVGATTVSYQKPAPAVTMQASHAAAKIETATTTTAAAAAAGEKPRRKMSKMGAIQLRLGTSLPSASNGK